MKEPKIVFLDLETLPILTEALKVWPQLSNYPGLTLKASISSIICAGYKISGEKKTHCLKAWDYEAWATDVNNDRALIQDLHEILVDADCIVTHNGKSFDWRFLQTRFLIHRLPPLHNIHHVDTKCAAKQHLFLFNNRLNTLGEALVGKKKVEHEGWQMWVDVWFRKRKAMNKMAEYCIGDVDLLEMAFKALKPLLRLPNFNHWSEHDKKACPNCGSTRLVNKGYRHTATNSYKRYQCQDCRTMSRTSAKDLLPRTL